MIRTKYAGMYEDDRIQKKIKEKLRNRVQEARPKEMVLELAKMGVEEQIEILEENIKVLGGELEFLRKLSPEDLKA